MQKSPLSWMLIFCGIWAKNIFSNWSQNNALYFEMLISLYIWEKKVLFLEETIFSKWSQNNVNFLEIMIFLDIWIKNDFVKMISRKCAYPRNVDIYGDMDKKQMPSKKTLFSLKCRYFRRYGSKHIFKSDLKKKRSFSQNVGIFGYMDKNLLFQMISKNVLIPKMLIFTAKK